MVTIGRPDLCQLVASLNHVGAYPREGCLDLAVRAFGYDKTTFNKQIDIDSRPMDFNRSTSKFERLKTEFIKDYPDAKEEMDPSFPTPLGKSFNIYSVLTQITHAY